ncbi:MAG: acyltransferase domain-containing protein, partial [Desulfatitalea sp.]|nr:acyltransferase domain-containing protein [Desulfatitalea sp.]
MLDAACASSMGALHTSVLELTTGRSEMAITGGVDTINDPFMHMCFSKTQILSPAGQIRPFSQASDGTLLGEGVGMVVLKRLSDAQRDGDRVYAVIKGIGAGSDGKSQSIYAPRASGQAAVLKQAYDLARVSPQSVALVEAHGTGTRVGDQVEFQALCEVFRNEGTAPNRCALGSVKSNIGHTKAAAGTAGLIKATLALYHKVLPPTLNAHPTDPKLGVEESPFYINHTLRPWVAPNGEKRRAGVSAFGFGGSNFHTVLEEYDTARQEPAWDGSVEIAAFSAATPDALIEQINRWTDLMGPDARADDIARQAAGTRQRFRVEDAHRATMVFSPADGASKVRQRCDLAISRVREGTPSAANSAGGDGIYIGSGAPAGPLAFLFPGQGSQYVAMGRDLMCTFPAALEVLNEAESHFAHEQPLTDYLYPRVTDDATGNSRRLQNTAVAQPAIGAVSTALLAVLDHFGITPAAAAGHSYGELVALHAAGWIDRPSLWQLSVARGRLMAAAGEGAGDAGAMLAVAAPLTELDPWVASLDQKVILANRNSPAQGVLSGSTAAIAAAESACHAKGWRTVRLPVAAAFHSHLVAQAQTPFQAVVDSLEWTTGRIPTMSNTLGQAYPEDLTAARALLGGQLANPVDFVANIENLYALGIRTFVEVGPKTVLTRLVEATLKGRNFSTLAVDGSSGKRFGVIDLADTLGRLSALGYAVHLDRWEKPLPPARTLRMRIPLSGANYRQPRPARPPKQPSAAAPVSNRRAADKPNETGAVAMTAISPKHAMQPAPAPVSRPMATPPLDTATPTPNPNTTATPRQQTAHDNMDATRKRQVNQIVASVQQGLSAMQAMQAQTTQAHHKYLEVQAEAHRTLQQMMRSTQNLAGSVLGTGSFLPEQENANGIQPSAPSIASTTADPAPAQTHATSNTEIAPMPNSQVFAPPPGPAQNAPVATGAGMTQKAAAPPGSTHAASSAPAGEAVRDTLQQIVSQLTGYPVEMLGLEMDIEADLGI